jgi:FkbH-like protein
LPEVAVPEVGSEVGSFAEVLEREGYFELDKLVPEDLSRSAYYNSNAQRTASESAFQNYDEFLESLDMSAEIGPFLPLYFERITQLINKTNQFNLTTRRYTTAEVESISIDSMFLTLYGRLADRFGDNGLVAVLIGRVDNMVVTLDVWLMSCRVLKRNMELAMFDALVEECQARDIREIFGLYVPSKKNGMVAGHYADLGFSRAGETPEGAELWRYEVPKDYEPRARHIQRKATAVAVPAVA